MKINIKGNKQFVFYIVYLILIGAVLTRMIPHYLGTRYQNQLLGFLFLYLVLFLSEHIIHQKLKRYIHFYFLIELSIILSFLYFPVEHAPMDYFMNLVTPLCGQAIWDLPGRSGKIWVAIFSVFSLSTMIIYYHGLEGVSFGFTYVAGCLFIAILGTATQRSDQAQNKSQVLLDELQTANWKLKEYASQVETLAIVEERNRMARELHDSVSQTIFSMTLTSQAARILIDSDVPRVASLLDHLQTLSQNALAEMRTLIQEFRENSIVEKGLIPALQKQFSTRLDQDGLKVDLNITGKNHLPRKVEEGFYRIVQEALNNVVKHAKTDRATVTFDFLGYKTLLVIEDNGCGFDSEKIKTAIGHVGLTSMEERVHELGGKIDVFSKPGYGTRIQIEYFQDDGVTTTESIRLSEGDPS